MIPLRGPLRWSTPLSESLESALTNAGIKTASRLDLEKVLKEQALSSSGITDEKSAAKLGKIAGAARVVTGSILPAENNQWIASIRVVNSETAVIEASTIQRARVLEDIPNLAKNIANSLASQLRGERQPAILDLPSLKIEQDFSLRVAINNIAGYGTLGLGIASGVGAALSFVGGQNQFQRAKTLDVSDPVGAKAARDSGNSSNTLGYIFTGVAIVGIGVALYFLFNPPQNPFPNEQASAAAFTQNADGSYSQSLISFLAGEAKPVSITTNLQPTK